MTHSPLKAAEAVAGICDPVWSRLRAEAEALVRAEPGLSSLAIASVLNHPSLESAVAHRVAARLGDAALSADLVAQTFAEAVEDAGFEWVAAEACG